MGTYDEWKAREPEPSGDAFYDSEYFKGEDHGRCECESPECANHPDDVCRAEVDSSNSERLYLRVGPPMNERQRIGVVMCTPCADDAMASGEWSRQPRRPERDN